eukprot:1824078-Pyramimonas_sp.AAC.1
MSLPSDRNRFLSTPLRKTRSSVPWLSAALRFTCLGFGKACTAASCTWDYLMKEWEVGSTLKGTGGNSASSCLKRCTFI